MRTGSARSSQLGLLLPLLTLGATPCAAAAFDLPHRVGALRVDGRTGDWSARAPIVELSAPAEDDVAGARARVRVAWDREALWALFEVTDPTPSRAPAGVEGALLFQWDSVELYVDGGAHGAPRMGSDDFQVLIARDGRAAVLQGDPLLLEFEAMAVPKRERPAVVIEAVAAETLQGYLVECAIPLAALGIEARAGLEIGLDLALNDWTAAHPPFDQLGYDLQTLHKLEGDAAAGPPRYDAHGLSVAEAQAFEARHYRPWAWSGSGDFGYPEKWRRVRLVGSPPLTETLVATLGARGTLVASGLATALFFAVVAGVAEWRHRRRIGGLLDRIAQLERARAVAAAERAASAAEGTAPANERTAPVAAARPPAAAPDPIEWLERAAQHEDAAGEPATLELRAIRAIRGRLGDPVQPADLARALYVSLRTLERRLNESLACSPGELILAVKMREARRLLEHGALQVQEVARRVGFDDPAHFARRFRAYSGIPPTAVLHRGAADRDARSVA